MSEPLSEMELEAVEKLMQRPESIARVLRTLSSLRTERDALKANYAREREKYDQLVKVYEELKHATRTYPAGDRRLRCTSCGAAHLIDTTLSHDDWAKIATENELLCTLCIEERFAEKGIEAECDLHFIGLGLASGREYRALSESFIRMREEAVAENAKLRGLLDVIGDAEPEWRESAVWREARGGNP